MKTDKDRDIEADYAAARQNYHKIITDMMDDIEEYSQVAKETEHPRAFEVLFNGYKAIAEMNDKFLEHQRKYQVIQENSGKTAPPLLEGQVYNGSIADFQRKLIENKKKKKDNKNVTDADTRSDTRDRSQSSKS